MVHVFFWGYRFISWLPFCLHILIIFGNINVFSPIWSMGNLSSIILFCRLYFVLMSKKKGSNQPWFKFYHIILTVKILGGFWAGFCELLGWKSSILSGNTALHPQYHDWGALKQGLPGRSSINGCLLLRCVQCVCVRVCVWWCAIYVHSPQETSFKTWII